MGHRISAILLHGPFDAEVAASYDLRPIPLGFGITLFPIDANHYDHWADELGVQGGFLSEHPLLNGPVVHRMVHDIAPGSPLFAIIETDYFGGVGEQAAVAYRGEVEVMAPEQAPLGPINQALRLLGVEARPGSDEFDTVGLVRYRDFDSLLEAYWPEDDERGSDR
jgi:hypothetical protein